MRTAEDVRRMRELRAEGLTLAAIAEMFNCCARQVWDITTGKSYKNIGGPIAKSKRRLTPEQVLEIRRRRADGESRFELADEFGCLETNISAIVVRRNWKHV